MQEELRELYLQFVELKARMAEMRKQEYGREVEDYELTGPDGAKVRLSELFNGGRDLIVIHNMGKSCPYCTLWADGINGLIKHVENRAPLVLVSPDSPETQREFAASRGWNYRMLSSQGSTFTHDLGFAQDEEGKTYYHPGASGFRMDDDGGIRRVSSTPFGPGDDFCAAWPLYELLEDGVAGWQPKYSY